MGTVIEISSRATWDYWVAHDTSLGDHAYSGRAVRAGRCRVAPLIKHDKGHGRIATVVASRLSFANNDAIEHTW